MKMLKKILSVFLTAVILVTTVCVGTVSASAESNYKVSIYDDSNYYYIKISNIEKKEYDAAYKNASLKYCPYIYFAYSVDDDVYTFGNMLVGDVTVNLVQFNKKDLNLDLDGYFKYSSSSKTYNFYFRMPKSNSNAKKHMSKIKTSTDIELGAVMFGLYGSSNKGIYDAYKNEAKPRYVLPEVNMTKSGAKKISSLEIDDVSDYTYTGKARKPSVKIYDGSYKLVKGTDYTLSYKNNKEIGTASVTIKGKGKYTGSKTIKFDIVPKKPTLKVSEKNGKITLKWSEVAGADKYQVYYSVNGGKYKKLVTTSKTSYSTTKLDPDDELKFRVRARTEADDEYYYSSFSSVVELD